MLYSYGSGYNYVCFQIFFKKTKTHPPLLLGFKPRCGEQGASKLVVALVPWLPTPRARWATRRSDSWAARDCPPGQPSGASLFSSTPLLLSRVSGPEGALGCLPPRVCDWSGVYFFSSAWSDDSCALTSSQQHLEPQVHDTWFHFLPRQAAWRWR